MFVPTELGPHFPLFDTKSIELANLFAQEEELAVKIKNDDQLVDKDTIYQAVALARRIAKTGYVTTLVDIDEFLDIVHVYHLDEPNIVPRTSEWWASQKLVTLLASLKDQDNSAWTARVAAALAYLSILQG